MDLYLLRPMIDRSRFERKKTVTPLQGKKTEEDGRRGWISFRRKKTDRG
jgi:hypothetical protein